MQQSRINLIKAMLEKEPNDLFLNYALSLEYAKENNLQQAILVLKKIIAMDAKYLAVYYQLGKLYENTNQKQSAITTYNEGIEIAKQLRNAKTLSELNEALMLLEE